MNYIKVTYGVGNSFIKSTFEDNSTYVKTSVNSTFIKVAYDGGDAGLDAERLRTKVYNVTGGTLVKGTVVYINGSHGNLPSVAKAIATSDATSAQTMGLVLADIEDNKSGYIILAGKLSDLDTQATPNGSQLYLSSTIAGTYTTTKQYAPAHLVYVGIVNRSHPTQGEIEVKIQNGYEADEIHDFAVRNPSNNDGIFFNSATSLWEKKQVSAALGYTPVPTSRTITINGVSYDLSADRSYTIAAGISGSGTSGQVAFWNGASSLTGVNGLFWDNGNSRLGIGINTPQGPLHINADITSNTNGLTVTRTNVALADANFQISSGTLQAGQFLPSFLFTSNWSSGGSTIGGYFGARISNSNSQDIGLVIEARTKSATALSQGYIVSFRSYATDYVRIAHNGNMLLQNGGTFSDDGINRLQVSGKAKVTGDMTINGMTVGLGSGNFATNVVMGLSAFISNTSGEQNIAIGYASLYYNTSGGQNVAIGLSSIAGNSGGSANVGIGQGALQQNTNGNYNTAIGYWAGYSSVANSNTVGSNNIFIGNECVGESGTESNRTWIGNASTTSTWVGGDLLVGTRTDNGTDKLQVVGGSLLNGNVTFSSSTGMFWDAANTRLGVGSSTFYTPGDGWWAGAGQEQKIFLKSTATNKFTSLVLSGGVSGAGGAAIQFLNYNGTPVADFGTADGTEIGFAARQNTANINFYTTPSGTSPTRRMSVLASGNVLIQAGGTFTDSGERLQVTGTMKVTGTLSVSEGSQLQWGAGTREYLVGSGGRATMNLNQGGNLLGYALTFSISGLNQASGTGGGLSMSPTINPTSGTAVFNLFNVSPTINQTGGANGITRGLYVNPTLTNAFDWRSLEWSNNSGWGLYGAGTAANYINGNLLVGSASSTGEKLQVTGTMRVTATGFNNTTFANAGQAVYNTYAPTGYSSWIIGVETQYFLGYSGRNILVFSRDRNHTTGGIDNNYIGFGHLGPTANVDIASSSTARASLRIRSGVAPTTPNDGDIWYDGTNIYMRVGATTKTFTLV